MARMLVFVLCASLVATQRNGNIVKERGEFLTISFCGLKGVQVSSRFIFQDVN